MADVQAAKRYAQAVFAIARDQNSIARWRADLDDVATVLAESGLAPLLADARVAVEQRQAIAERTLSVSPMALNLVRLLIAKGRASDARAVADAFKRLADEAEGLATATVTTAIPLQPAEVEALARQLGEKLKARVTIDQLVDPAIVGGIVIRVGDRIVDGSIRTRLRELRKDLVGAR
jgi:F-type H+-transporting ATPase subunit delta